MENALMRTPTLFRKTAWMLAWPLALLVPDAARAGGYALTTLHSFKGVSTNWEGGVTLDAAGNIYGATFSGGVHGGSVFKIDAATGEYETVAEFTSATGGYSAAGVTLDAAGNLYGTTSNGGANGSGTVFKIDAATGAISPLAAFDKAYGSSLSAGVTLDAAGNVYATMGDTGDDSLVGLGSVFKIDAATGETTTLAAFNGANGRSPISQVTLDAAGNLYGTTGNGGAGFLGTVFKIDAATGELSTLAAFGPFDDPHGRSPWSGVALDAAGNIYGTSAYGAAFTQGAVFRIDGATGEISTVATFDGVSSMPSGIVLDAAGNLYGATQAGGAYNQGRVYKIDGSTGAFTTLYSFGGADGATPVVGVTLDAAGNIYGRTSKGGEYGYGTIFRLSPNDAPAAVPEPAGLVMLGLGAGALALVVRRKKAAG